MKKIVTFSSMTENPDHPGVFDISPEEVRQKSNEVNLIDVRKPDEYVGELGHIPGAKLITLDYLAEEIEDLPKDSTIVFICRSGGRSGRATALAQMKGLKHVYNMKGGMMLWNALEFETTTEEE